MPFLPDASLYFTPLVYTFALISIIYSSLATLRQIDLKSIIAYSSIGHMSVCILGLFSNSIQGIEGAIFLSLAHGITSPALFILVTLLYERHSTRILKYFRGLVTQMPLFAIFFFIFTLANCGTPLTANWIGELLSFIGSFQTNPVITTLAGISMILSAAYSFWLYNRITFGQESLYLKNVHDITRREFFILLPLLFLIVLLGIFPNIILELLHHSVSFLIIDSSSSLFISNSPPFLFYNLILFFTISQKVKKNNILKSYMSISSKKGFEIYLYSAKNNKLIKILPSAKEARRYFKATPCTIVKYATNNFLLKEKFILSLTPLETKKESLSIIYIHSHKYLTTSNTSLTI